MTTSPKSWLDRLLEMAVALVAIGLLLTWAWALIRPLLPVMVVLAGLVVLAPMLYRHFRGW